MSNLHSVSSLDAARAARAARNQTRQTEPDQAAQDKYHEAFENALAAASLEEFNEALEDAYAELIEQTRPVHDAEAFEAERVNKTCRMIMPQLTTEWRRGAEVRRSLPVASRPWFDDAVAALRRAGDIDVGEIPGQALPGVWLRLNQGRQ